MSCLLAVFIISMYLEINAVPPEACFANFRWDDCGRPPKRVLYYWKPGSRCEVGVWRGCLPNLNMFEDEYECVATCIFTSRSDPADYHDLIGDNKLANDTLFENETITEDIGQITENASDSTDLTKPSLDESTDTATRGSGGPDTTVDPDGATKSDGGTLPQDNLTSNPETTSEHTGTSET